MDEQYPVTSPPTVLPSIVEPYIVDLSPKGSRYPLIEFDVLPKDAWNATNHAIVSQTGPYAYTFPETGTALRLKDTEADIYTGNYNPYLYYFAHPILPYMFTVRLVELPKSPKDLELFYEILDSVQLSTR